MSTLWNFEWDIMNILQCVGCFAVTDGDIVLRSTNSSFKKRGHCTLFYRPNIVSITTSCYETPINQHWPLRNYVNSTHPG